MKEHIHIRFLVVMVGLMLSCIHQNKLTTCHQSSKEEYFNTVLLNKFKSIKFPCILHEGSSLNAEFFPKLDSKSEDTLFFKSGKALCYGRFSDTRNFVGLITYVPTVNYIPVITTFDQQGNILCEQEINFGCWDGGPDHKCEGTITIDSSFQIKLVHKTTCFKCDSTTRNPIVYLNSQDGFISKSGQIVLYKMKNN
jgi:hypothetical protein